MERPSHLAFPEPRWPWLHSLLRITFTLALIWGFFSGSHPLSLGFVSVLAVAYALAILLGYELSIRDMPAGWIAGGIFALIGIPLVGYGVWEATRPPAPVGPLLPAREPTPRALCAEKIGPQDLVMAFGTDRAVGAGPGPFSPIQVGDCNVMLLRRMGRGLMVDAIFYNWNRDVAFIVNDNIYQPLLPLQLRPFRPDPQTIVILDRFDKEVLYVRYLNTNAVRIRGRFLCGEQPQAIIRDDRTLVGGIRIGGAFLGQRLAKGQRCATIKAGEHGIAVTGP